MHCRAVIKCLNLRLFIDAQHHRPLWRVEVKPDDIGDFLLECWIVRDLETLRQMRFETGLCPYAADAGRRNAHRFGHQRPAPMGGIRRALLNRPGDHLEARFPGQWRHP